MHRTAKTALEAGELERANRHLMEARAKFFEAVRLAAPEEILARKSEQDYKQRLESVNALLGAYKHVASEKGSSASAINETVSQIERYITQANGTSRQWQIR